MKFMHVTGFGHLTVPKKAFFEYAITELSLAAVKKLKPFATLLGIADVKEAEYELLLESENGRFEIRKYSPSWVAEVTLEENYSDFQDRGFHLLADFIFGENSKKERIEMMAPVYQSRTILDEGNAWKMSFFLPKIYTAQSLPNPNDAFISIVRLPERKMAIHRFSGPTDEKSFRRNSLVIRHWMASRGLEAKSEPILAAFGIPFVPSPHRRNEIHIEI